MIKQITGLRGLAIILIVLFHFFPQIFPHGHYGVEVFLVISGFLLMHSAIKEEGRIDLKDFFRKKVIRLFAPISASVILTLLAGLYFLDYDDLHMAGTTACHTLAGTANYYLMFAQADYFAQDSSANPFLHMWYIGVTVQIYLLFAMACWLYRHVPAKLMFCLLLIAGTVSLLYAYSYQIGQLLQCMEWLPAASQLPSPSHYNTLTRLWPALAGAAIAAIPQNGSVANPPKWLSVCLSTLGVLCVLVPAAASGINVLYHCSAVVVLGTCLVILYGKSAVSSVCIKPLLWVGAISFSLYLVHMPLIAGYRSWLMQSPGFHEGGLLISGAVGLAVAFYFCIEKRKIGGRRLIPLYLTALLLSVAACNGLKEYIYHDSYHLVAPIPQYELSEVENQDLYRAYNEKLLPATFVAANKSSNPQEEACLTQMGTSDLPPSFVLMGDSHAWAALPGLDQLCKQMGISGVYLSSLVLPFKNWELPPLPVNKDYFYNREKHEALFAWLNAHPEIKHVVIATYWAGRLGYPHPENRFDWDMKPLPSSHDWYESALKDFIQELKAHGKQGIILAPALTIKQNKVTPFIRMMLDGRNPHASWESISCTREEYLQENKHILPMLQRLEEEGICSVWHTLQYIPENKAFCAYENGEILYRDDDHMSPAGSIRLFRYLEPQVRKTLGREESRITD